jgi:hypothetical protein
MAGVVFVFVYGDLLVTKPPEQRILSSLYRWLQFPPAEAFALPKTPNDLSFHSNE